MFRKVTKVKNEITIEAAKDLLRNNMRGALCVNGDDGYVDDGDWAYNISSCVVFGRARLVTDPQTTEETLRKFACKYYPTAEEVDGEIKKGITGVQMIEIEIEHISGKKVIEK